jgi:hypothetical protein
MERLAFLAALTASVLAYTYYPRMPHRQLRRIGDAFNKPNPALKQNVLLRRLPEEQVFKSFFGSQPAGHPLVAVGPDGSSKSVAMRSALRGRTNVLYIDLRQTGVQNESEFICNYSSLLSPPPMQPLHVLSSPPTLITHR